MCQLFTGYKQLINLSYNVFLPRLSFNGLCKSEAHVRDAV